MVAYGSLNDGYPNKINASGYQPPTEAIVAPARTVSLRHRPYRPPVWRSRPQNERAMREFAAAQVPLSPSPRITAHPIDGLDVLITGSCGDGFSRKLAARGIRVVVTSETDPLTAIAGLLSGAALPPPVDKDDHDGCECHCASVGKR
jgi:hypothetical protein